MEMQACVSKVQNEINTRNEQRLNYTGKYKHQRMKTIKSRTMASIGKNTGLRC